MVRLVQNMPSANNGEQYKDNNNNITKYLEFNKDSLIDLAKKKYENIVEVLAYNIINSTVASSNPTVS
jgi:hypothetical protein